MIAPRCRRSICQAVLCVVVAIVPAYLASCSDPPIMTSPLIGTSGTSSGKGASPTASAAASASSGMPSRQFRPEDFNETDQNRDPFRSYIAAFSEVTHAHVHSERQVVINRYSVDELRLIALVTHTDVPRAMLIDPTGRGWSVTKGQFVGRAEVVHGSGPGGVDYELNWRVDRIRDTDIVLLREDPAHGDVTPATRVITLRSEKAETPDDLQVR